MRLYFGFSVAYLAVVLGVFWLAGGDTDVAFFATISIARDQLYFLTSNGPYFAILIIAFALLAGPRTLLRRVPEVLLAAIALLPFSAAFAIVKTHLPVIAGIFADPAFFADPFFAGLDRALHLGVDPYILTHEVIAGANQRWVDYAYGLAWGLMVALIPVGIALADDDARRKRDFIVLYLFATAFLGNVLALLGMSAGPVYYDRLFGGEDFAGLTTALEASGLANGFIGSVQAALWEVYEKQALGLGMGISAFPSVHVATTTVGAIYIFERSRLASIPAFAFLALILVLSVHTGYHYAVDGYASIALVFLLWRWLRRDVTRHLP